MGTGRRAVRAASLPFPNPTVREVTHRFVGVCRAPNVESSAFGRGDVAACAGVVARCRIVEETRPAFVDTVDAEARAAIAQAGRVRQVRAGTVLLLEGERSDRLMFILEGLVKVTTVLPDGNHVLLAFRGPGELVGELATIDGGTRSASATSVTDCEVRLVPASEFRQLLAAHPSMALSLIDMLVARLRESDQQRVHYAADGVARRLARSLLELADSNGVVAEDGSVVLDLAISQDDLAGLVAASRDSVARTLKSWRSQGLVETARRHVRLVDPAALSRQQLL